MTPVHQRSTSNNPTWDDFEELLDALERLLRYSRAFTLDAESGETAAYKRAAKILRRYKPEAAP